MRAELFAAGLFIASAVAGVRYWEDNARHKAEAPASAPATPAPVVASAIATRASGDEVRLQAAADRHFYVTAAVNESPSSFLVDTGASYVALRDSDARKAGIHTSFADYTQTVRTANGETRAAVVDIRSIEIGRLRVDNVRAFVLEDSQLNVNLLGMSFLSRLDSVETRGGEMVMRG